MEMYALGLDFGTDSVRTLVVDAKTGSEVSTSTARYPRWKAGIFCDPARTQFSQHPLDYMESMESCVKDALRMLPAEVTQQIVAIGIDATGSTPCAVDRDGVPLSLKDGFVDNPNAMFILWKDHRAEPEAREIADCANRWGGTRFTEYSGGDCSPEWFWPKVLHVLRHDAEVREAAFSWVELCDWIPALLTGNTDPLRLRRSRGAAGHKALWNRAWNGLPSEEFLVRVDPLLAGLRGRLYRDTYTADKAAGRLSGEWAERLGLPVGIPVTVGTLDGHVGGLNCRISPRTLVKTIGTSSVDVMVVPPSAVGDRAIPGLLGQVDGSLVPGLITLEAGQAAFGDLYAWLRNMFLWPWKHSLGDQLGGQVSDSLSPVGENQILEELTSLASRQQVSEDDIVVVDWFNGRRSPHGDLGLKGVVSGLTLQTSAVDLYRALVEATAFGTRAIAEHFVQAGFPVDEVIVSGAISHKNAFVMQVLADVLNLPVKVVASEQACAAGVAILATVAGGCYASVAEAQEAMGKGFRKTYSPRDRERSVYDQLYRRYCQLGQQAEAIG